MSNIFETSSSENAVDIIRQTMSVALDDNSIPTVTFSMNRGKGSGAQTMPVTEFRDYVGALQGIADDGISADEDTSYTAAEMVKRTAKAKDGVISFRVRDGKGSKPAKVAADQIGDVAELLAGTISAVETAGQTLGE